MKTSPWPSALLSTLLIAGSASSANASLFSDDFDAIAVAETAKDVPQDLTKATSYVAFDAGYIEAGDPIAGDTPPTADQVRQDLGEALSSQGFQAAEASPALVLIYNWGVLRVDHLQIRVPYGIKTNLRARIALVSTDQQGAAVENHILTKEKGSGVDTTSASPRFLVAPYDAIVQRARLPRIFVVVSAYDYQAMAQRHEAKLVWTAKLSAQETSGNMSEVIPPLIAKGAQYFGKDSLDVLNYKTTLGKGPGTAVATAYAAQPSLESYNLEKPLLESLMRQQRVRYSGEN